MAGPGTSKVAAGFVAGALIATMATGITYAATNRGGVKACTNSDGVLRLLSADGRCPAGFSFAKLGARGPAGPAGVTGPRGPRGPAGPQGVPGSSSGGGVPGALSAGPSSSVAQTSSSVEVDGAVVSLGTVATTGITGITAQAKCRSLGNAPEASIVFTDTKNVIYTVHGDSNSSGGGLARLTRDGDDTTTVTINGLSNVAFQSSKGASTIAVSGGDLTTFELLIVQGNATWVVDGYLSAATTFDGGCQAAFEVTSPST